MKVTLVPQYYRWILLRIETDVVCIEIGISPVFPPFKEMYTWLGRIRDRQLPVEMIINEEGRTTCLIAKESEKEKQKIEFSVRPWKYNSVDDIYLKTVVEADVLIASFHDEIISTIAKQFDRTKPSFIVRDESLNWARLLKKTDKPQDWRKRLAIYGVEYIRRETHSDNFSLTLEQEYLFNLKKDLEQIYTLLAFETYESKKQLGKIIRFHKELALASFLQELAIDIALNEIDTDWYEQEQKRLNTKYKIDERRQWKTATERREEYKKITSLKQTRLKTLQIGQIVDGNAIGLRSYGAIVDIGGFCCLLHISNISQLPVEDPQQVFSLDDWVRAIIVDLNIEKGRVSLSTKDLESEPGQMLTEPWTVYQNAEVMAKKCKEKMLDSPSQPHP